MAAAFSQNDHLQPHSLDTLPTSNPTIPSQIMTKKEDAERKRARAQAVDEEYNRLEKFHVDRRRIVFIDSDHESSGGYGIVQQAELHHSAYLPAWVTSRQYGPPPLVAVKQMKISAVGKLPDLKRAFTKEMLVWSGLGAHPGIAKFLGFYADFKRSEAWLLSPWEPYGNISEFVHERELEVPEKLSLVYDTIDALTFLHQMDPPVCHGDIKSANVLVNAKFRAVLCDFGLARLYEDSGFARLETSTGFKGSIRWCSPEIVNGCPRTPTSDIYSWAWLVWEIMTGRLPYEGSSADYVIIRQIFESPRPQVDGESRLSDCLQVWELMTRCWEVDPLQRPTASMCRTTVTYLPRCAPTPGDADHQTRSAALLENLGDLESWKGNTAESFSYLNEALKLYEEEENAKGIASVLRKQTAAWYRDSDFPTALSTARTTLEHCRNLDDALGIAEASFWLGCSLMMQDMEEDALPILRESLEICRTHGNDVGAAQCLERIGEAHRRKWRRAEALSTLEEAVTIASGSGDKLGVARALIIIGVTYWHQGDLVKGTNALSEACTIARKIGWDSGVCGALFNIGDIKMSGGEYQEAEELFQESISVARRSNTRWRLAQASEFLGKCFQAQGRLDEAGPVLEEAYQSYQASSWSRESRDIADTLAKLKSSQGNWDHALFWYDRILDTYRGPKDWWGVGRYLEKKGDIMVKAERYDEAALHFEAAMVICLENDYSWGWRRRALITIPKTAMRWERRLPLLCDGRRLQRRLPQLTTACLKLPITLQQGEP